MTHSPLKPALFAASMILLSGAILHLPRPDPADTAYVVAVSPPIAGLVTRARGVEDLLSQIERHGGYRR